ncbi:glycosyltransferase family 32 protein [Sphingosinicella sp. BN140058]|uniref:glycosyltransferase family 32 protein n=1 Tax=Sphingosinicella sp. BN140058 TaxID=1892855 RepID=UPI001012AAE8|nr:glycosyltransferase [Sphingosinicella sp. BN140058]QAY79854.1 glycosyltransferase [Sphingosinicella sp. BN140058]
MTIDVKMVALGSSVPRIIHQTYATKDLPSKLRDNVDALRRRNPGWKHRLYDDADIESFIAEHYGSEMLARYLRINPAYGAARADLFRYLLMYQVGGVYLDIKSTATRPLDEITTDDRRMLLAKWDNGKGGSHENWGLQRGLEHVEGGEFQQWHIIAAPGHPLLRAVIDHVLRNIERYRPWRDGVGREAVFTLTGPVAYTLAITPLLERNECTVLPNERMLGLEYSVVAGEQHRTFFDGHYAERTDSIVKMSGLSRLLGAGYSAGKRMRRRLGRLKTSARTMARA